jgi:hypothetical protein
MDRDQAKEILLHYRPGREDATDPQVVEAMALVGHDPELARWFEQQQRADEAIRARLRETRVPDDLKRRILAEQKVVRVDFGWRKPMVLAAAAAILLLGAISGWIYWRETTGWNAYRAEMVHYVSSSYNMYIKANNFDELRQVLAQRQWPTDFIVPDHLQTVTVLGGGAMQWKGHKVALACMKQNNRNLWLFVIEKTGLRNAPDTETPRLEMIEDMPTAAWSQGGNAYLLTAQADEAFLKKYLP